MLGDERGREGDELLDRRPRNQDPGGGAATLPGVAAEPQDARPDHRREIGRREHHGRALAPELEDDLGRVGRGQLHHMRADGVGAGERHEVDLAMGGQLLTDRSAARDQGQHPGRYTRLLGQPHERDRAQRSAGRRQGDHGAPSRQRWPDLPGQHVDRVVVRRHRSDDPQRLPHQDAAGRWRGSVRRQRRQRLHATTLRSAHRHLGAPAQVRGRLRNLKRAGEPDRRPDLGDHRERQFLAVLLDQVGQPVEHLGAAFGRQSRPRPVSDRAARGGHGLLDLVGPGADPRGHDVLSRRVNGRERRSGAGHPPPVDEARSLGAGAHTQVHGSLQTSMSRISDWYDLPCGSARSVIDTPPPSARSRTKFRPCDCGISWRTTGPSDQGPEVSANDLGGECFVGPVRSRSGRRRTRRCCWCRPCPRTCCTRPPAAS